MIIKTQLGLGDCIYLRPVLKHLPLNNIYLETSWPQVFLDLPGVKFIKPEGFNLRTQKNNIRAFKNWVERPEDKAEFSVSYDLNQGTIIKNYCDILLGRQPNWFDNTMNIQSLWCINAKRYIDFHNKDKKKVCLIRPNTLRAEWTCPARNPHGQYLQRFVNLYKKDFFFISIADIKAGEEWYDYDIQNCGLKISEGVPIDTLIGLFFCADIVVCSPSFWSTLGLALNTNMVIIYGAHEPHFCINDIRIKTKNYSFVEPEPFDRCHKDKLNAYKEISIECLDKTFKEGVSRCLG